jgi:hypothetical protein
MSCAETWKKTTDTQVSVQLHVFPTMCGEEIIETKDTNNNTIFFLQNLRRLKVFFEHCLILSK